jgi:hypothetical protein
VHAVVSQVCDRRFGSYMFGWQGVCHSSIMRALSVKVSKWVVAQAVDLVPY